ncbi:COBRA plant [Arabidopsis thaliana x Arabidopsis arenosa]|uniref:COBRA plant n=1 Tax=Arabidopsis thaliana x Arabidopsis arenosa TaxID=1240361 RepID=A0A8T2ATR8_9BRAS|nr:COBRA plant [Arabidopsis thaliana x Arabidopsis arenosa]
MGLTPNFISWILLLSLFTAISITSSQPNAPPPRSPDSDLCNGVFVSYTYSTGTKIKPNDTKNQPYRFESEITVLNNGRDELKSWRVFVEFAHREILVSATNAVLSDGSSLPVSVENGTIFAGFPSADLKSAIMTAGDVTQMQARVKLVGTQFGVAPPNVPLPKNITLVNDGWSCPKPTQQGRNVLQVCCTLNPNITTGNIGEKFLPRQEGDLTIMYDVTKAYQSNYLAQVTIENHNLLGRLDNWNLSFLWMKDEFIFTTKGAYPSVVDSSDCINGPQGKYYKDLDFSHVLSCARRPHIIDLPLTKYNDTDFGRIPYCCRNGTILPRSMDPEKSKSVFQIQVYKMPPDLNMSAITPPQSWQIKGNLNPDYKCGPPVRVSSSQFPDPSGLPSNRSAFASWQVVCNITQPTTPKCCVSFSSYFNDSIIPCNTCACGGCTSDRVARTCSTTSPALLLPSQALLIPFENRTKLTTAWAELKHRKVPDPLPCGDNCGVSINWHLATDYRGGWTARVTLFNWGETDFVDWFTAVELRNAAPGFEKAYSFNGTTIAINGKNTTVLMEGLPGLNYLLAERDGKTPSKDFRLPGKQQSVISFTKKLTPGLKVGSRDGFPTKVLFNGQECSLPSVLPTNNGHKKHVTTFLLIATPFLALLFLRI